MTSDTAEGGYMRYAEGRGGSFGMAGIVDIERVDRDEGTIG